MSWASRMDQSFRTQPVGCEAGTTHPPGLSRGGSAVRRAQLGAIVLHLDFASAPASTLSPTWASAETRGRASGCFQNW